MAVEDVVIEANISRATFYRHFDSKFAIFVELLERFSVPMARYDILLSGMAKSSAPSLKDLTSWVERLIDLHAAEKLLVGAFQQMMAIEHDFRFHADRMSLTICERLGKTIPAFRKAHSDLAERFESENGGLDFADRANRRVRGSRCIYLADR